MHELAIAGYLVDAVQRHAAGRRVTRVGVRIGHLRQVVPAALTFNWELVTNGTAAEGAELSVERVEAVTRCPSCSAETVQAAFPMRCGTCGASAFDVVRGDELVLDWLELEADQEVTDESGAARAGG